MKKTILSFLLIITIMLETMVFGETIKHALVIGNSAYKDAPLKNPANDANDMTATLQKLGFAVITKTNVNQQAMEQAMRDFEKQLKVDDVALFYFSGHGIQVNGINYLLPIDTDITSADEIKYKAVDANMILDKLENAGSRLNIIILDACRNNPFKQIRSVERGLAMMSAPTGTLIAYATAPGSVAYDASDEQNSPYTKHLLSVMQTPGLEVEKVFKQVRIAVMAETADKQVPWESSSLTGDFYFTSPIIAEKSTPTPIITATPLQHQTIVPAIQKRKRIAFISNRDGATEIYTMNSDGTDQQRLTYDLREKSNIAWSPDRRYLAYGMKGKVGQWQIYVMNADGNHQRQLTYQQEAINPVWSPDGQFIAFSSNRRGNWDIYVMNADGTQQRNISKHSNDFYPFWTPDGRSMTFHSYRDNNSEIYVMNADGKNQLRLTKGNAEDWMPIWSSDGQKIIFWSNRDGSWEIYSMKPDGSKQKKLNKNPTGAKGEKGISRLTYSPDGQFIAYNSVRDGNQEIYVMNSDGTNQHNLTNSPGDDYDPAW